MVSKLKKVPQKKVHGLLSDLQVVPVPDSEEQRSEEVWRILNDERMVCTGTAVAEKLDELGIVDASFLSELDEEIASEITSFLKAIPQCKVKKYLCI